MNKIADYQIFVASSLKLVEHRKAVADATEQYNKEHPGTFYCWEYEYSDIEQTLDQQDAQGPIQEKLIISPIFFLIIEENIKPLTRSEFEMALELFKKKEMPRYIYIFRKENAAEESTADNAWTYKYFKDQYNLNTCRADRFGELVPHSKVYDIPFTDMDSLKSRVMEQLEKLTSKTPPSGAKYGYQLTKEDFYSDRLRLDGFPNNINLFYKRVHDDKLREELKTSKLVLLTSCSLSGKTRSVMEALRMVRDGWVYAIGDKGVEDGLVEKLEMLNRYMKIDGHVKLYIEIDNLDQHVAIKEIREALYNLINTVMEKDCNGMIVATASNYTAVTDHLPLENYGDRFKSVDILPMSEREFRNALSWFRLCGEKKIIDENLSYQQLGALFVNLTKVKSQYRDFLNTDKIVRQALLKAIKAQSIWRLDAFGDKELMQSMTEYFAEQEDLKESIYQQAENDLCEGGRMGVSMGKTSLHIEEYVYQYVIGYDGNPTNKDVNDKKLLKLEKELAKDILLYCYTQQKEDDKGMVGSESLTRQVSRIVRRCDHQAELTRWLYNLWSGSGNEYDKKDAKLTEILQADRDKCERESMQCRNEEEAHYYSSIVRKYLITTSGKGTAHDMEDHLKAYERVPEGMRVDELFGSLLRTAKTVEERHKLMSLSDHEKFKSMPDTVLAKMEWAENYDEGKKLIEKVKSPCAGINEVELATRMLDKKHKPYDMFLYNRMLHRLATLVRNGEDFDDFCSLLRENIVCLISDQKLLEDIKNKNVSIKKDTLTIIDLMGALGFWIASQCAINAFGDSLLSCEILESKLIHSIGDTLNNKLTNELQIRIVVSTICSRLINVIAENEDYDKVYDTLFAPLEISHPLYENRKMILRNTYTYTAMMKCRGVDVRTLMNLFTNDLLRHVRDNNNPLTVTRYTINSMLEMCKKERRLYLNQVNNLYDLLGIKRDLFAYNILIKTAPDIPAIKKILNTMKEESITPNLFTYLNIQRNNVVNFKTALHFLYSTEISIDSSETSGDILSSIFPNEDTIQELIKEIYTFSSEELYPVQAMLKTKDDEARKGIKIQQMLHLMPLAWLNLLDKQLDSEDERVIYNDCLKHLRDNHSEMLKDGKIYNVVLKNRTFIVDIKDAIDFITKELEPSGFVPDGYTASSLLDKVLSLRGIDQREGSELLNKFINNHPRCLSPEIITFRLKLFRNQSDYLKFVFFDKDNIADNKSYTPINYLSRMVELGIPLNTYAINNFMKISDGLDDKKREAVVELLKKQSYKPNATDIKTVRECIMPYCSDLPKVYGRMTPMIKNKSVAYNFKELIKVRSSSYEKDIKTSIVTKKMVTEALESLDWSDSNSALCSLHDILDKYVGVMRESMDGEMWPIIKEYYDRFVVHNPNCSGPTSFILNLLAKSLTDKNAGERNSIIAEVQKHVGTVIIQPHLLGELSRTTSTVKELIELTQAIKNLGCKPNVRTADIYVYRLCNNLLKTDLSNTMPILTDLSRFVFDESCDKNLQMLEKGGRVDLLLTDYNEKDNISENFLYSLLLFNTKTNNYTSAQLAKRILDLFTDRDGIVSNLMNVIIEKKNLTLAQEFLPKLFNKNRDYSVKVLSFLSSPLLLPKNDIKKYNELLEKFNSYNCALPDDVIINLLQCLDGYHWDRSILERLKKIYVNITLGLLRQGDMLMQTTHVENPQWCHRSLDCTSIRDRLKKTLYPTLANLYVQLSDVNLNRNMNPFKALRRAETLYTSIVSDSDITIDELYKLPDLWYAIKWPRNPKLVTAIVHTYATDPFLTARNIAAISFSIVKSKKRNPKITSIPYSSISRFSNKKEYYIELETDKLLKALPHPFIVDLCVMLFNKKIVSRIKSDEKDFIKQIECNSIKKEVMGCLPPLLSGTRWSVSPKLLKMLREWVADNDYYIKLLNYISNHRNIEKEYLVYLSGALKEAEKCFSDRIKSITTPAVVLKKLNKLPDLWWCIRTIDRYMQPSQYLVETMIGVFANIPSKASRQLAFLAADLKNANVRKNTFVKVRYTSLGDFNEDPFLYVKLPTENVRKAMPHHYILSLCSLTLWKSKTEGVFFDKPEITKEYENEYIRLIKDKKIDKRQLRQLSNLWKKANWHPQNEIVKLLNDYKESQELSILGRKMDS